jgi:ABC-type bacteriocin/lantibiotic exporter with double-glycine peptidase domain
MRQMARRGWRGLLFLAVMTCSGNCLKAGGQNRPEVNVCGRNATYTMLRMLGFDVPYENVRSQIPDVTHGVTLSDIRQVLNDNGMEATVAQLSPTDLFDVTLPCAVLLDLGGAPGDLKHIVVMTEVTDDGVVVVDPVVATQEKWPWHYFSDAWTGYAVIPNRPVQNRWSLILPAFVLSAAVLAMVFKRKLPISTRQGMASCAQ